MRPLVAALATAALSVTFAASAQDKAPAPQDKEAYRPGLGEIMALQQMRHIKLWFAGHDGNWPLADYEIGELKEGFDDVTEQLGGDIVEQHVGGPLADLQKAVDGKNSAAFTAAFDSLSAGCNACHHTLDHPFIVIQRPMVLPYSNQVFTPQR
jgi:cytochrome c556